jgi:hypothetical protein
LWRLKHATDLRFIFAFDVEEARPLSPFGSVHRGTGDLRFFVLIFPGQPLSPETALMEERVCAMYDWMIGVGFVVLLMTPCFIAMRPGAEDAEVKRDDQEAAGAPAARRLKLL